MLVKLHYEFDNIQLQTKDNCVKTKILGLVNLLLLTVTLLGINQKCHCKDMAYTESL